MSERRGPLSFLDTEWRTGIWKRWVSAYLIPEMKGEAIAAEAAPSPAAAIPVAGGEQVAPLEPAEPARPTPKRAHVVPDETRRNERRADVRARFDALSERLQGLEDAIDVIARRISQRARRERRTDRRTAELVEHIAESVEAHANALDGLASAIERIERRMEHPGGYYETRRAAAREDGERRETRAQKARNSEPPPRSVHPPRLDDTGDFSQPRDVSDDEESSISGSSIRGSIGDMSLSTVLAMLEIERRSGRLKVQADDGALVAFELEDGSVVGSRVSENDSDAVESLREVLTWKNGRFWFRQNPAESMVSPPRSVNSLLLEATRQIDEAIRTG